MDLIRDKKNKKLKMFFFQQINNTDDDGLLMNIVIEGMICDTGNNHVLTIVINLYFYPL